MNIGRTQHFWQPAKNSIVLQEEDRDASEIDRIDV
jgi:hypothetical protein